MDIYIVTTTLCAIGMATTKRDKKAKIYYGLLCASGIVTATLSTGTLFPCMLFITMILLIRLGTSGASGTTAQREGTSPIFVMGFMGFVFGDYFLTKVFSWYSDIKPLLFILVYIGYLIYLFYSHKKRLPRVLYENLLFTFALGTCLLGMFFVGNPLFWWWQLLLHSVVALFPFREKGNIPLT